MRELLSRSTKGWYAVGQAAEGIKNESFSLFLLFYYTQVLGLSGSLSGRAILIALLFDAVTDPLAGVLSDRFESRWGRRHPFIYAAAFPVAVTFYLVFSPPPGLDQRGLFAWLVIWAVLCRGSMTLFHVPHLALGAELSRDYEERTRIVMWRHSFSRIGGAVPGVVGLLLFMRPTAEFANGQLNPAAYPPYAATAAVLMFAAVVASGWGTHSWIPYLATPASSSAQRGVLTTLLRDMWEIMHNRSFRALFFGSTVAYVALGVAGTLGLHLGTYFWKATTSQLFLWGLCAGIGIFSGLVVWARAAARLDKKPVFIMGMIVFTVFTALPALLRVAGWWVSRDSSAYIPVFVLTTGLVAHFGISSTMVTGGSMMADVTDEDVLAYGRRREGIFFGAVSFAAKSSVGVGSQIAGWVIDFVGLVPGAHPEDVAPQVVRNLGLTLGVTIILLVGVATAIFSRYELTRERHASIQGELSERLSHAGTPAEPAGETRRGE